MRRPPRDSLVLDLLQAQHGLVTRRQALEAGLSASSVRTRLERGDWECLGHGVYRVCGAPATWHQRALMPCLALAPHAALSHRSAAYVWRLDRCSRTAPEPIEVAVPHGCRTNADVQLRTTRTFERGVFRGMPVTPLTRTLIDLASELSPADLEVAVESALRFDPRVLVALKRRLNELPRRGREGIGTLRELVAAYDGPLDSALEVLVRKLLFAAGLPKPHVHFDVWHRGGWIANVDFAWPKEKVAVQAYGLEHHLRAKRYRIDRRQESQLIAAGWLPISTTWEQVTRHPVQFIRALQETWAQRVRGAWANAFASADAGAR